MLQQDINMQRVLMLLYEHEHKIISFEILNTLLRVHVYVL